MGDNIIDFQQRRALEQAIGELAATESELELVEAARQIKFDYPSRLILPALLRQLDTPSSQLRGGLARLAALLPSEESVPALRQVAGDRRQPPQARVTAVMILERFLGETVAPALTQDLRSSDDAAFQSLSEAVDEGKHNRHVLLEYVTQMQQLGEEIALLVMQHLDRLPAPDRVDLLRLIAQDSRPAAARAALDRLETLAAAGERPAARALHTLALTLPPATAQSAERALHKLRLRGAGYTPPPASGWRALLAPAQVGGLFWIWFMGVEEGEQNPTLAGLLLQAAQGIVHGAFADPIEADFLPPPQPTGTSMRVSLADWGADLLLELPFDVGRWLVRQALVAHWEGRAPRPPAGEYALHNDLLWQFAAPQVDPDLAALVAEGAAQQDPAAGEAEALVAELLAEACFDDWSLPVRPFADSLVASLGEGSAVTPEAMVRYILRQMETTLEQSDGSGDELRQWLHDGLREAMRTQAVWLHAAGKPALARGAGHVAQMMTIWPPSRNPLLHALLLRGLERA